MQIINNIFYLFGETHCAPAFVMSYTIPNPMLAVRCFSILSWICRGQDAGTGWPEAINIVNHGRKSVDAQVASPTVPEALYRHTNGQDSTFASISEIQSLRDCLPRVRIPWT